MVFAISNANAQTNVDSFFVSSISVKNDGSKNVFRTTVRSIEETNALGVKVDSISRGESSYFVHISFTNLSADDVTVFHVLKDKSNAALFIKQDQFPIQKKNDSIILKYKTDKSHLLNALFITKAFPPIVMSISVKK